MCALGLLIQEGAAEGAKLVDIKLDLGSVLILVLLGGGLLLTIWAGLPSTIGRYGVDDEDSGQEDAAPATDHESSTVGSDGSATSRSDSGDHGQPRSSQSGRRSKRRR